MSHHIAGLHHLHHRKRMHQNLEPYPHPNPKFHFMDRFIYLVGVIGPVLTIPQILQIWIGRDASGINLITWSAYVFTSVCWTFYAGMHKEKALLFNSILWIVANALVVIGTIIYG